MSDAGDAIPTSLRTVPPPPSADAPPTRLVLVRHGEAVCHLRQVVGGARGCTGLSENGRAQAEALRRRLERTGELARASALYTSVLARARQTAQIIAPAVGGGRLEADEDCSLCELHPGDADAFGWREFRDRFGEPDWDADPDTPIAPGGESWNGFVSRAATALSRLAEAHGGEQVVVVCHAGVIEAAMLVFLPVGRRRLSLRTEYVSITEFEAEPPGGPWRPLRYNDAAHLVG